MFCRYDLSNSIFVYSLPTQIIRISQNILKAKSIMKRNNYIVRHSLGFISKIDLISGHEMYKENLTTWFDVFYAIKTKNMYSDVVVQFDLYIKLFLLIYEKCSYTIWANYIANWLTYVMIYVALKPMNDYNVLLLV